MKYFYGEAGPVLTGYTGTNADLIAHVARLYLKAGDRMIDLTYGRGAFWKKADLTGLELFVRNDIKFPYDGPNIITFPDDSPPVAHTGFDFRNIVDKGWAPFDIVVFDPPYKSGGEGAGVMSDQYGLSALGDNSNHGNVGRVLSLYEQGIDQGYRLLADGGTMWIKCQDGVESGKQHRIHIDVHTIATSIGFTDMDFFTLTTKAPRMRHPFQLHARKNTSHLWVMKK